MRERYLMRQLLNPVALLRYHSSKECNMSRVSYVVYARHIEDSKRVKLEVEQWDCLECKMKQRRRLYSCSSGQN